MGAYEAADAIRDVFESEMAGGTHSGVPRAQNGNPFNGPKFEPSSDAAGLSWVQLNVATAPAVRQTLGPSPRIRYPGEVVVKVFTPRNRGFRTHLELADFVASIWWDASQGAGRVIVISADEVIRFRPGAPTVLSIGESTAEQSTWQQSNVVAQFFRDTA